MFEHFLKCLIKQTGTYGEREMQINLLIIQTEFEDIHSTNETNED